MTDSAMGYGKQGQGQFDESHTSKLSHFPLYQRFEIHRFSKACPVLLCKFVFIRLIESE